MQAKHYGEMSNYDRLKDCRFKSDGEAEECAYSFQVCERPSWERGRKSVQDQDTRWKMRRRAVAGLKYDIMTVYPLIKCSYIMIVLIFT